MIKPNCSKTELEPRTNIHHHKLIFKKPIRYILYTINSICLLISIGDYNALTNPECVMYQCIASIIWFTTLVAMYFHTRIFEKLAELDD